MSQDVPTSALLLLRHFIAQMLMDPFKIRTLARLAQVMAAQPAQPTQPTASALPAECSSSGPSGANGTSPSRGVRSRSASPLRNLRQGVLPGVSQPVRNSSVPRRRQLVRVATDGQADGEDSRQTPTLRRWFAPLPSVSTASSAWAVEATAAAERAQRAAQASDHNDADARAVFATATPCSAEIEEFVAMPDGSFCRVALLSGAPSTSTDYDRIERVLRRQPCDDVRRAIFSWTTLQYERLDLWNQRTKMIQDCGTKAPKTNPGTRIWNQKPIREPESGTKEPRCHRVLKPRSQDNPGSRNQETNNYSP